MSSTLDLLAPWLRYLVPLSAILLMLVGLVCARRLLVRGLTLAGLVVVAALSLIDYTAVNIQDGEYFNEYEFFHYYLGARYSEEVGYFDLYNAVALADEQNGRPAVDEVRDLRSNDILPISKLGARMQKARERFSGERWSAFSADVDFFRRQVSPGLWGRMLTDKGYNATPVWTMVGEALAKAVPTSSSRGMLGLALVDVGLWALTLITLVVVFGLRPGLLVLIMLGTHYVMSHTHYKASFIRVDWICALLLAMAAARRRHPALAGALLAWSSLSRVFPVLFLFGPFVSLLHGRWTRGVWDRDQLRLLGAFGLSAGVLVVASVGATSLATWREFLVKIGEHASSYTAWRVGFRYVFALTWDGKGWGGLSVRAFYQEHGLLYGLVCLALILGCVALVPRVKAQWEQLVLGFFLVFLLTGPTYYYYAVLLVPTLWLASRHERWPAVALLSICLGGSMLANALMAPLDRSYGLFFAVSAAVFLQILGMAAWIYKGVALEPTPEDQRANPSRPA